MKYLEAVKIWNHKKRTASTEHVWMTPKKGTKEYEEIQTIMKMEKTKEHEDILHEYAERKRMKKETPEKTQRKTERETKRVDKEKRKVEKQSKKDEKEKRKELNKSFREQFAKVREMEKKVKESNLDESKKAEVMKEIRHAKKLISKIKKSEFEKLKPVVAEIKEVIQEVKEEIKVAPKEEEKVEVKEKIEVEEMEAKPKKETKIIKVKGRYITVPKQKLAKKEDRDVTMSDEAYKKFIKEEQKTDKKLSQRQIESEIRRIVQEDMTKEDEEFAKRAKEVEMETESVSDIEEKEDVETGEKRIIELTQRILKNKNILRSWQGKTLSSEVSKKLEKLNKENIKLEKEVVKLNKQILKKQEKPKAKKEKVVKEKKEPKVKGISKELPPPMKKEEKKEEKKESKLSKKEQEKQDGLKMVISIYEDDIKKLNQKREDIDKSRTLTFNQRVNQMMDIDEEIEKIKKKLRQAKLLVK
jgi:hypothetical protein